MVRFISISTVLSYGNGKGLGIVLFPKELLSAHENKQKLLSLGFSLAASLTLLWLQEQPL